MKDDNFKTSIGVLKGLKIGLFLNDKQFVEGILLDVKQDHLVVDVNHNVFYFALQQIHAITNNAKDFHVSPKIIVPHLNKNLLTDVLKALKYNWVTINSLSNQRFVGLLSRITEDHIQLINNEEQLNISKSYISNIYNGIYEINELQVDINQEKDVQDSLCPTNGGSKERSETSQAEMLNSQQEEQVTDKYRQKANNIELEKNGEAPFKELPDKKETEVEHVKKGYPLVKPKTGFKDEPNFTQVDTHNLLNQEKECSPEVDCPDVLESSKNSVISDDHLILPKPQICHKKKTKRPIPFKNFSNVQPATWEILYDEVRGVSTYDGNSNKKYPQNKTKNEIKGKPNFPLSDTHDLLNEKCSPEAYRKNVVQSSKNRVISEEKLIPTVPHLCHKKKRKIPITIYAFSRANQAIIRKIIFVKVREVSTHDGDC